MGLQFEGAVDNISEPQLAFIRDVLEKRGYMDTTVSVEVVGNASDNYGSNVKRIVVRDEAGEFRMIAKIAPQHELIRGTLHTQELFRNEHLMYTEVLPKLQQLEKQANIQKEDRLRFAECYGSLSNPPHEVILLEDLVIPGFTMLDKLKPLPDECIRSVLKNFALLHSLSYALKHKEPESFDHYRKELYDIWSNMVTTEDTASMFKHLETLAMSIVSDNERKRLLNGCVLEGLSLCGKLATQDSGSRFSVIQQGDAWSNNILFRYEEDSLQESILIDYQLSKETNPTCDLMYMLFNCTDHAARLEHFNDWIDYYHSELEKALSHHSLKVNFVYPRDQLDADLRRYAKVILGISVLLMNGVVVKPEHAAKMKENMEKPIDEEAVAVATQLDAETVLIFKQKLEGLVDTVVKFGLF